MVENVFAVTLENYQYRLDLTWCALLDNAEMHGKFMWQMKTIIVLIKVKGEIIIIFFSFLVIAQ